MAVWLFRLLAGSVTLFGLALQFWLMVGYRHGLGTTILNFVSYFTILTNILLVLCLLLPLAAAGSPLSRFWSRSTVRTAVVGYGAVVAIIYAVYLRNIGHDRGLERLADQILHYVTPAMFAVDWLVFVPKGRIGWAIVWKSLVVPVLYAVWTLMHGGVSGWYPYPFLNVNRVGYSGVFASLARLAGIFIAVSLVLLAIDRALAYFPRRRRPDRAGQISG
jgi:hypothetical protein